MWFVRFSFDLMAIPFDHSFIFSFHGGKYGSLPASSLPPTSLGKIKFSIKTFSFAEALC